jgi:hypothetical protein
VCRGLTSRFCSKLKRQASKDGNLHGEVSSPRTNKKKEKEKEKEKEEDKGKSKETVSSPKAARKTDEKRATLTKSSAKEKPVSEKKKKTHHQEITEEEEVETRSFIKNGQEKIKIKKTIKFPFTRYAYAHIFLHRLCVRVRACACEKSQALTVRAQVAIDLFDMRRAQEENMGRRGPG